MIKKILNTRAVKKHTITRKGIPLAIYPIIKLLGSLTSRDEITSNPPIIINSLPKSGTHLLLELAKTLPNTKYYGRFIATTPSLTLRQKTNAEICKSLSTLNPREVIGAHIHFSQEVAEKINSLNAIHLFIYRDPRDVIASESIYLAEMNKWHKMHRHFKKKKTEYDRIQLAINGIDDTYKEANARILPYAGWISEPNTFSIRYEDLIGEKQQSIIEEIIKIWNAKNSIKLDDDRIRESLKAAMNPANSHTFRSGGKGKWKSSLTTEQQQEINQKLQASINAFCYNRSTNIEP